MEQLSNNSRRRFLKTGTMLGLGATFGPSMIRNAFASSRSVAIPNQQNGANAMRPFHVNIPEAELTELRRRIRAARWPERELVRDASQGVQLNTMQKVAQYW